MNTTDIGRHLFGTIQASPNILNHPERLTVAALDACREGGATIIGCHAHKFDPHGVTAFVILAESHFSIHTWPERGTAAVDIFTCGEEANPYDIFGYFLAAIQGSRLSWHVAPRSF